MKHQHSVSAFPEVSSVLVAHETPVQERIVKRRIGFFTGDENHVITLEEGIQLTRNYRKFAGKDAVKGGYFGREIIERIIAQDGCVGIRFYHGERQNGKPTFVLTGVESSGNDLFQGILGQEMRLNTTENSHANPLNSDSWKKAVTSRRASQIFSGNENHFVTLAEASEYTRNYRINMLEGESKGRFYAKSIFRKILAQSDCVGIRVYYARHDDGSPSCVLVGVDQYGIDLVSGVVGQKSMECPPWCAIPNPLNR